jgi:hypothetical protein
MTRKREPGKVRNAVLRELIIEIEREKKKRCSFPHWGNWGNWGNWMNWNDWGNWGNWMNWWN